MIAAVALDKANGSYRIAARHLEEVAQIYQDKLDEPQKAYDYYDEASALYHADNSPTYVNDSPMQKKKKAVHAMRRLSAFFLSPRLANRCTLKAAELAAILGQYDQAISKFETVAFASIDDTLLSWSVKEYFLQAALCHICTKV
jgi:alpha-soluble NSF attachment protein